MKPLGPAIASIRDLASSASWGTERSACNTGLLDDGQEVVLGKINRDNPCADGMLASQVLGQLPQPVFTAGDQHEVHADPGEASGEGFSDPRRGSRDQRRGPNRSTKFFMVASFPLGVYEPDP